jgi:hypothetical protein
MEAAPQQRQPKASKKIKRQQERRVPEKQASRDRPRKQALDDRAKPRRQERTQSASPNVYFERDPQLGFAAQLRQRTCNPATGNMPMQCYYPRAGRQNFPSKPLD